MVAKAEVLVYMDTSVRFRDMDFEVFFDRVRRRGGQFLHNMDSIPNHTLRTMFHFYGEEECTFTQFPEILAGFSAVHNEPFMNQVNLSCPRRLEVFSCALIPAPGPSPSHQLVN